jgi:hypothetical protein
VASWVEDAKVKQPSSSEDELIAYELTMSHTIRFII